MVSEPRPWLHGAKIVVAPHRDGGLEFKSRGTPAYATRIELRGELSPGQFLSILKAGTRMVATALVAKEMLGESAADVDDVERVAAQVSMLDNERAQEFSRRVRELTEEALK